MKPNWMRSSSRTITTHGSPHPYDTHVPIMFWGPSWVASRRIDTRADMADVAPTLAAILGVRPPSASEGRALSLGR